MSRPLELLRYDAEEIVDLIEAHSSDQRMLWLAAKLREQWGMAVQAQEQET